MPLPCAISRASLMADDGHARRVGHGRLDHRVVRLDHVHHVLGAGAADHDELVAAGLVDRGHHADALVVVVVPERVDLRRGLQQVGRHRLAGLDGELGRDLVAHLEAGRLQRVGEALAAVLGQRQVVDALDLGDDRVADALGLHLLGDVACRRRRPCRSCRRRSRCATPAGCRRPRSRLTTGMPASIALMPVSVSALPSNGRITMTSTFLLIRVSTWLICWLTSLVPSTASRVTSLYFAGLALGVGRDGADPAVVGLRVPEKPIVIALPGVSLSAAAGLHVARRLRGGVGVRRSLLLVQAVRTAPAPSAPAPTGSRGDRGRWVSVPCRSPPSEWMAPSAVRQCGPNRGPRGVGGARRRCRSPAAARCRRPRSG